MKNMNNRINATTVKNINRRPSARMFNVEHLTGELQKPEVTMTCGGFNLEISLDLKNPKDLKINLHQEAEKITSSVEGLQMTEDIRQRAAEFDLEHGVKVAQVVGRLIKEAIHESITLIEDETPRAQGLLGLMTIINSASSEARNNDRDLKSRDRIDDYRRYKEEEAKKAEIDQEFEDVK